MAITMQDIVNTARLPLNDADPLDANRRWPDATLFAYAKSGLQMWRNQRSDLWYAHLMFDVEALLLTSPFPLEAWLKQPLADYVAARSQFHDDEVALQKAAQTFYALFKTS